MLIYQDVRIYLKHCTHDPLRELAKTRDGEHYCFFEMMKECKVSCVEIFLAEFLGSQYYTLHLLLKIVKMYLKNDDSKKLCTECTKFFKKMKEGLKMFCVKSANPSLAYLKVSICIKYCTPHPL